MRTVALAAALVLAGCAPVHSLPPKAASVDGTSWRVVEMKGQPTPQTGEYRISFEDGRLGARFGCNHMGGPYRQVGSVLHPGQIASTAMGCPEPANTFENHAMVMLGQPMSISWTSRDTLELSNRSGGMKLVRSR